MKPLVHGNGGWYGMDILSSKRGMQLGAALKIKNPDKKYDVYNDWYDVGHLGAIRICYKPDANYALYYFNGADYRWEKI